MNQSINHEKNPSLRGYVEIDLNALFHNFQNLRNLHKKKQILPVVKTNAYGHGLIEISKKLQNHINLICVLSVDEGIKLRKNNFKKDILLLTTVYPFNEYFKEAINYNLIPTISTIEELSSLKKITEKHNKNIKFHLKVDTGMHRMGVLPEKLPEFLDSLKTSKGLQMDGVFTHFSSADIDKDYTNKQIEIFNRAISKINEYKNIKMVHAANSAASILYKSSHYDAIRPGIALYGLLPFKGADKMISLKPVLSWKSKIILIKELPKNSPVSYGQTYITKRKTKLAVISVGYADGYSRLLSNKGYVLIKGKRAPILGRVTMDLTMVDVTDIKGVKVGDEVVLIGKQGNEVITAEEIADLTQTINYEVVTKIHPRVKRIYIG